MSSGAWVISVPVTDLNTNGAANSVNITAVHQQCQRVHFDGRIVYASLWDVYQKASLNNTFQYAVAEGSGDIYSSQPGTHNRPFPRGGSISAASTLATSNRHSLTPCTPTYMPGKTTILYINSNDTSNGILLGGDPAVSSASTYAPVQASFDVTSDLSSSDNWIKYSVDPADGVIALLQQHMEHRCFGRKWRFSRQRRLSPSRVQWHC